MQAARCVIIQLLEQEGLGGVAESVGSENLDQHHLLERRNTSKSFAHKFFIFGLLGDDPLLTIEVLRKEGVTKSGEFVDLLETLALFVLGFVDVSNALTFGVVHLGILLGDHNGLVVFW